MRAKMRRVKQMPAFGAGANWLLAENLTLQMTYCIYGIYNGMRVISIALRLIGTGSVLVGMAELWLTRLQWPHSFDDPVVRGFRIGCLLFLFGLWLLGSVSRARR
jgi:hypothetical protein